MEEKSLNPPIIEKTLQKKFNILTISLLLCSKKTHPALPPKKDKRYELKNIKMLLQIDSKYQPKIEKKDSLQKNPYHPQIIPLHMIHKICPHKKWKIKA